jgi:hypothetical protein
MVIVGCSHVDEHAGPLMFVSSHIDLGEQWAGENFDLTYPYEVANDVMLNEIKTNCGCFSATLLIDGQAVDVPYYLKKGDVGEISVQFRSAGFSGVKATGLELIFSGQPSTSLTAEASLKKWFETEPEVLNFGRVDDSRPEVVLTFTVKGQEPFRFTEVLGASPDLEIDSVPTTESALSQEVVLRLNAPKGFGEKVISFNLLSDYKDYRFVGLARYYAAPAVWTVPADKVLLGQLPRGLEAQFAVDLMSERGKVGSVKVSALKLPNFRVIQEYIEGDNHKRLFLGITPRDYGAFNGELNLEFIHEQGGKRRQVLRKINVYGLVPSSG